MQLLYLTVINKVQWIIRLRPLLIFKYNWKYYEHTKHNDKSIILLFWLES